jgi:hypothetical protein
MERGRPGAWVTVAVASSRIHARSRARGAPTSPGPAAFARVACTAANHLAASRAREAASPARAATASLLLLVGHGIGSARLRKAYCIRAHAS